MHVALIAAHLIAYPTDASRCAQREAQAMVLQSVILGYINRDYEVIMMGDFNDFDGSVLDVNSNKPTSMVLDILKGMNQNKSLYTLHSIAETITQDQRYSDWYDSDSNCATASSKDYSTIDHVLVTPALQQNIVNTFIYHGYKEFCGKYDSDHFPVVIDFLF
jgi:exonuclease III